MTTKTNIKRLQELREKAREISVKNPTKIAIEFKTTFNEELQKLKASEEYKDYGTGGRMKLEEKLRQQYRERLFEVLAEQQAEYKKVTDEITTLSKTILATPHEKPADDLTVKLFEQEFQTLTTSTMLGSNGERSVEAIDAFIGKYGDDHFFASVIKDSFAQLAQNVLSIDNNPSRRQQLAKIFERVEMKATNDEQKAAAESLEAYSNGTPTFYREGLPQYEAISNIIGGSHARYLDKPAEWVEAQAAEKAEQATE